MSSSFSDHEWGTLLAYESEWVKVRVGLRFGLRVEVRATGRVRVSVGVWFSIRVTVEFRVRVNVRVWAVIRKSVQARVRVELGLGKRPGMGWVRV